jgi:hypothetical protein
MSMSLGAVFSRRNVNGNATRAALSALSPAIGKPTPFVASLVMVPN